MNRLFNAMMMAAVIMRAVPVPAAEAQAQVQAQAQTAAETGAVAAIQGSLRAERAGSALDLTLGAPVYEGDRLRTGPGDRAKLVFLDDSVIDMAPSTEIILQSQQFDPVRDKFESTVQLTTGKVRVALGERYLQSQNRYELETPSAVAVRGTELVATYNVPNETTEVISATGQVDVLGKLAVVGAAVQVGPLNRTEVKKGKYPSAPAAVPADRLAQYMVGLNLVGTGRRDGLNVLHPVLAGKVLAADDVPGVKARAVQAHSKLSLATPREFLADEMSADVRTNTQPLLEYRRQQPGLPLPSSTGGVHVDF